MTSSSPDTVYVPAPAGVPAPGSTAVQHNGYGLAARLSAEALGTFLLVFAGLGIELFNGAGNQTAVPVGFGFGVALIAGIIAFGHVSGGHFNPAVSVAAAIAGKLKWLHTLWYAVAQVVGATVGTLVLFTILNIFPAVTSSNGKLTTQSLFDNLANGFADHSPSKIPMAGALLIEVVGTAIFVAVILGATQARANTTLAPLAIGLTFAVVITVALPLTNASMNPARSTAAALFAEPWATGQLWLFWVAPLLGAAVAGLLYRAFAVPVPTAEVGLVSAVVGDDEIAAAQARSANAAAENDAEAGAEEDGAGPVAGSDAGSATSGNSGDASPAGAAGAGYGRTNAGLPKPVPASAPQEQATATPDAQDFFDNPQPKK
ncbi:MAG: aquaporin [Actinomycetota bacterium]|nr:aquaporin [Actinomycetota bacterium]